MRDTVLIEEMTWVEVKEAIQGGKRRVIVMLGAMEQHGPHMPIGTDTYLGYATGERLTRRLGDALVAPTVTLGYSVLEQTRKFAAAEGLDMARLGVHAGQGETSLMLAYRAAAGADGESLRGVHRRCVDPVTKIDRGLSRITILLRPFREPVLTPKLHYWHALGHALR